MTLNQALPRQKYFDSLDLVRGVAALVVLIYHADFMFGLRGQLLPAGYLAVDLFFVLSGFVLSLNYGSQIMNRTASLWSYAAARFARLYPLFLATTAIGVFIMTLRHQTRYGYIDTIPLLKSAFANLLMLPSFATPYDIQTLYIFNPATWSIFFEVIASFLFFFYIGRASRRALIVLACLSGAALVATIVAMDTVDLGYATFNFWAGFPRVVYSFTVGVLIQRAFATSPWRMPRAVLFVMLLALLAVMQVKLFLPASPVFDCFAVLFFLPAVVVVSAGVSLDGMWRSIATFLGEISYSVYLLQGALIIIAAGLAQALAGEKIYDLGIWVGFVFVPCAMILSFATYRLYEKPARLLLRKIGNDSRLQAAGLPPRA